MADTKDITGQAAAAPDANTPVEATTAPELKNGTSANEAFARRERQIRRMQEKLQRDRQAIEAKAKSYETDYVPKSRLKEDFWAVAQEAGLDYDMLTEQVLSQPNDPVTKAMLAKVRAMEEQLNSSKRQAEELQAKQYEQAKKQIHNQVKLLVDGDAEFETIKSLELYDDVVDRIEAEFQETGIVRDVREVTVEIENELIEDAIKFAQLPKIQARLQPKTESTPATDDALKAAVAAKQAQKPMTTITNRMETQPAKRSTDKERRERAMAAFLGQNKG